MHGLKNVIKVVRRFSMSNSLPIPDPSLIDQYIIWLRNQQMSENTVKGYVHGLEYIRKNASDMETFFADPTLKGKKMRVYAYRSYMKFLCEKAKLIDRGELMDVLDTIKAPKKLGNGHNERKWSVPKDDWEEYIRYAPNQMAKMGIWIGFQFGLRLGEIVHLRIQDIDIWLENEREYHTNLLLIRSHTKKNQEAWHPKYNRERQLPITELQANIFRKWINEIHPENLEHDYLLWQKQGKYKGNRLADRRLQFWCNQTGDSVGLQHGRKFRPHIMRYSFATHYYQVSKDVKLVGDLLGHSNVSITSEYLQLGQKETMDKARQLFGMN